MTRAVARDPVYRRRRFPAEIIELCVRWYITYRLSYRNLVAMMAGRGITVSHTTILRWVLRYVPEFEKRWGWYAQPVSSSWRMDETAVSARGGNHYLYRAVDPQGRCVDHLLCADRSWDAAQAFFRKAIRNSTEWPRKINLDGNKASHLALRMLGQEEARQLLEAAESCVVAARASGAPSGYAIRSARGEHSPGDRLSAIKPDKSTCYEQSGEGRRLTSTA